MEQWLPRQPLILAPVIPLMWTVSWLCIVSVRYLFGIQYPQPAQLQDSVLLVSAMILLANIYNLILIYQRADQYRDLSTYSPRAMLLAIILIISIVLAWGQPKRVLIPNHLTIWVAIFIILNFLQAILGEFFAVVERPKVRRKLASLSIPTVVLTITGLYIPLYLTLHNSWALPLLIIGVMLLIGFAFISWQNLPGIFSKTFATNSVIYEILIGANIVAFVIGITTGSGVLVLGNHDKIISLAFSYFLTHSLLAYGISGFLIAAMQRYNNDYRYGHVNGHPRRYAFLGGVLTLALLATSYWLIK